MQFENLPAFIKMWNQSAFKQKYLQSQNFDDLSKRHLGMKIASRWQEFSDAAGFPIDLDVMSTLADKRAAVAVYDIGKMDLVFIAPMRSELFEATTLMKTSTNLTISNLTTEHTFTVSTSMPTAAVRSKR